MDAQAKLIERFLLSDAQANAILEMRVYRLTALEVDKINAELEDKEREIADYQDILANIGRVNEIIKTEMLDIKARYNTPRLSEISYDYSEINIEDLIEKKTSS